MLASGQPSPAFRTLRPQLVAVPLAGSPLVAPAALACRCVSAAHTNAAIAAAACGAGADGLTDEQASAAAEAAAVNESHLVLTAELDTTEMLDARTGEITTIGDTVTGDRAVLLWYWAPD